MNGSRADGFVADAIGGRTVRPVDEPVRRAHSSRLHMGRGDRARHRRAGVGRDPHVPRIGNRRELHESGGATLLRQPASASWISCSAIRARRAWRLAAGAGATGRLGGRLATPLRQPPSRLA
jgi:hypothetical protein